MLTAKRYFCDSSFEKHDNEKWFYLINMVLSECTSVELNILRKNYNSIPEIRALTPSLIRKRKRKNKIVRSGYCVEYKLDNRLKNFIKAKQYSEWRNYYLEDIAFLQDDREILSTITHENYVIMFMDECQKSFLNVNGFNFDTDWGTEPWSW